MTKGKHVNDELLIDDSIHKSSLIDQLLLSEFSKDNNVPIKEDVHELSDYVS